ncbi:MAG TPA: RHS repeat-associated core domain-containing protein [Cytophagaceae bacterium]
MTRNGYNTAVANNGNAEMDKLVYDYYPNTNKLKRINETTTSPLNSKLQDLTQQADDNYEYDEAGYLKFDNAENLEFKWTYNGKISEMIPISSTGKYKPHVKYAYDAQGNRVKKEVNEAPFSGTGVRQALPGKIKTTTYARDAQGNIMAVYEIEKTSSSIGEVHTYKLKELPIYGSDRIGIYKPEALIDYFTYSATQKQVFANRPFGSSNERQVGKKEYELKDHLGNVRVVFGDVRSEASPGGKEIDVRSYYNYYAFGATQPGRNKDVRGYRFNFNGKEMDYEIGWQDHGMRIYRPDIGRFGSVDPIASSYPELTPYQFASNRPIDRIDLDGLEFLSLSSYRLTDKQIKVVHEAQVEILPKGLSLTDVNDATVLSTWITRGQKAINIDGTPATGLDKGFAAAGAVVPFVSGSAVKQGLKYGLRGGEWTINALRFGSRTADAISGGSSALRQALIKNGADLAGKEAHHIIPTQLLKENKVVQDAVDAGFDFNGIENGMALTKVAEGGVHANHPRYTQQIRNALNQFANSNKAYTPAEAMEFLKDYSQQVKKQIQKESIDAGRKLNKVIIK